jgi:hypothetical protein
MKSVCTYRLPQRGNLRIAQGKRARERRPGFRIPQTIQSPVGQRCEAF